MTRQDATDLLVIVICFVVLAAAAWFGLQTIRSGNLPVHTQPVLSQPYEPKDQNVTQDVTNEGQVRQNREPREWDPCLRWAGRPRWCPEEP